jgi:hypothetical protein
VVVRPRRPVPGDGLVVLICAVRSHILRYISSLSLKVRKLCLSKLVNSGILLSCCLRNLWALTLSWHWGLISSNRGPKLTDIIIRESSGSVRYLRPDLWWHLNRRSNNKADPVCIGQLTITLEALSNGVLHLTKYKIPDVKLSL